MKSKFLKNADGTISQKIIVDKDYYDAEFFECDERELPEVGKTYFVWTRHYIGPNRNRDSHIHIRWPDEDDRNQELIDQGMGGNSNHNIKRYHGWRGTTDDNHISAEGVRTCLKAIRKEYLKTVHYLIVFGKDEASDKD